MKRILIAWCAALPMAIGLTAWMVRAAYIQRGYQAIGGEWMLLPLVLVVLIGWTGDELIARRRYREAVRLEKTVYMCKKAK